MPEVGVFKANSFSKSVICSASTFLGPYYSGATGSV